MTQEKYEEMVMSMIVGGGNARSLAMEAIQEAKAGHFEEAEQLMKDSDEALGSAHATQTELMQAEIQGENVPIMILMIHAQDHFMDSLVVKDMAEEFISLYKNLEEK